MDAVTRLVTVKDWDVQVQAYILAEIVLDLLTETVGRETTRRIIVGTQATTKTERGVVASLGNINATLRGGHCQLGRANLRLHGEGVGIDGIRRDAGQPGLHR